MEKQFIPLVGGALFKDGKLLVLKRTLDKKFLPGVWEIPGGKVVWGEDPCAALKREFMEETGLKVGNLRPFNVWSYLPIKFQQSASSEKFCIEIDFLVNCKNSEKIQLSALEHSEFKWIEKGEKLEPCTPEMLKVIGKAFETSESKHL